MRPTPLLLGAFLLAACGSTGSTTTGDAGGDASTQTISGHWVWESNVPTTGQLNAIWASSASDVWAGGDGGRMMHFDGSAWSTVDPATTNHIEGIWGASANDVWAVAGGLAGPNTANLVHWSGQAWSPVDPGTTMNLKSVWGSGPKDVYVAGASGVAGAVLHFDGASWSSLYDSSETSPASVFGSSASDVWVVGGNIYPATSDDFILHVSAGSFAPVASGVTQSLASVYAASPNDAWATGAGGLLHWNGQTWSAASSTIPLGSGGVWGLGTNQVFAIGGDQRIAEWNGSAWSIVHADPVGGGLAAVGGSDATHLWAVGANTTVLRFDTAVSDTPSCSDIHGTCGDASACGVGQGHVTDYACSGASTCCVVQTSCGGAEPACCNNGSDPGPRAVCHNGAFYCPSGSELCPQHP